MTARRIIGMLVLVLGGSALYALNHHGAGGEITPRPLLYLVADTQREIERMPLELTRISDEKENEIGADLARAEGLRPMPPAKRSAEEQRIEQYLNVVGHRVAGHVKRTKIFYRFYFIPDNYMVNAAAMPGGQIVVGRGLLRLLKSEDELAAILGHEIAHVDERHSIERMQYEMKARQLGLGGIYDLGAPAIQLFEAGYTKEQEADADRIGLEFAVEAGYSAGGALDEMRAFEQLEPGSKSGAETPVGEMAGVPIQALQEYFRSHPPASERLQAFQEEIAEHHWNADQPRRPLAIRPIFLTEEAAALDARGEFEKAIAHYREAIQQDPIYGPARRGLVRALWRSGDAAGAAEAAVSGVSRDFGIGSMWHLYALALAASGCPEASQKFETTSASYVVGEAAADAGLRAESNGLEIFCGVRSDDALLKFDSSIRGLANVVAQGRARMIIAGWLYRAGHLDAAERELEMAHQTAPQEREGQLLRAWVLSDLGRQADALYALGEASGDEAERLAASATIHSRTGEENTAKMDFMRAAQADPVWMEPHWAEHNFSVKAAAILAGLRTAEIARRKEEEAKRRGTSAGGAGNPR